MGMATVIHVVPRVLCTRTSYSTRIFLGSSTSTCTMPSSSVDNDVDIIPVCNGVAAYSEDNPLGDDGVRARSQAWTNDQSLSTLNLSANGIGAAGAEALGIVLKASFSITSVDCSRNGALGDEGAKLLLPALCSDGTSVSCIRTLNLLRCGIGDVGATALAQGLRGNSVLEQINLTGNSIGNEGVIALADSLVGSSKGFLQDLWLSSNRVGPAGAEGVAAALAKSPSLRELHLSGNALGDVGVTALVRGAVAGRRLRGLYVGGCGVSNAGAKDIANVLPNSLHLETLCLGHCAIGDDGASALARALAENHALRRLLIPGNRLMTAGGKAIAGMLLSNGSLFCLDVSNNYLGPAGIEAMAKAIAKNTTLLELNVSGCGGTDAAFLALAKAVEANTTLGTLLYSGNHLNTTTLVEMDYAMGRPKRSVRELVGQVQKSIDQRDLRCRGEELVQSNKLQGGAHPSVQLTAGQETSVQVSFGRKDNIVGSITVTNDTSLEEARLLIGPLLRDSERDAFRFITTAGKLVPPEDEPARRVVWDCGVPLRLRPANWVVIGHA